MLTDVGEVCISSAFILRILVKVIKIIRWVIPILLILLVSFDLFKVVSGQPDDKAKKEATEKIVKRIIYALLIFLVPTIINFVFKSVDSLLAPDGNTSTTPTSWMGCWVKIYNDPSYGRTYQAGKYSTPTPYTPVNVPQSNPEDTTPKLGCCYKVNNSWYYESNYVICNQMGYVADKTKSYCDDLNNGLGTSEPGGTLDNNNRLFPSLSCTIGDVNADVTIFNTYTVSGDAEVHCSSSVAGSFSYTINNSNVVRWDQYGTQATVTDEDTTETGYDIVPNSKGTATITVIFTPLDTNTYQSRTLDIKVEVQ